MKITEKRPQLFSVSSMVSLVLSCFSMQVFDRGRWEGIAGRPGMPWIERHSPMPANARPPLGPVASWPSSIRTIPSAPEFHRILGLAGLLRSNRCARLWRWSATAATRTLERFGPPLAGFTADWELGRRAINSFPHPAPKVGNRQANVSITAAGGTRDLMSTCVATVRESSLPKLPRRCWRLGQLVAKRNERDLDRPGSPTGPTCLIIVARSFQLSAIIIEANG